MAILCELLSLNYVKLSGQQFLNHVTSPLFFDKKSILGYHATSDSFVSDKVNTKINLEIDLKFVSRWLNVGTGWLRAVFGRSTMMQHKKGQVIWEEFCIKNRHAIFCSCSEDHYFVFYFDCEFYKSKCIESYQQLLIWSLITTESKSYVLLTQDTHPPCFTPLDATYEHN